MAEDFFGNLSKTLKKTVDTVGKKTDEFVEIQKIRTRQHALEDQIEKNYQDIGQIIYNRYLNGEAFDENLAGICKDITDLEKEIADCKEDVANKRGRIVCPACGASVPKDAAFCMRCGAAMPETIINKFRLNKQNRSFCGQITVFCTGFCGVQKNVSFRACRVIYCVYYTRSSTERQGSAGIFYI